ncbi:MAG: T9SS type A sorting domain-containing protein [Saprospiraceae bacterium]|nr:T9SS type A sorting domain-containing protein [Saprospiraceae bacterium]
MRKFIISCLILALQTTLLSQISINTPLFTYSQNFNSLANSGSSSILPVGWFFREIGIDKDSFYVAGSGTSNTGNTYSFGSSGSSERALGGLRSDELVTTFGVKFINNTGGVIPSVTITYTGEQWRIGSTGRMDRLIFQYSLDADSLHTGTWTNFTNLDFIAPTTVGPVGRLNGNLPENRRTMSFTIPDLDIPDGGMLFLRWLDFDATDEDDGLSVDDFIISNTPLPIVITSLNVSKIRSITEVRFSTVSEVNSDYFSVERSGDGRIFTEIGRLKAAGESRKNKYYTYIDQNPIIGTNYYRVRQVDTDGNYRITEAAKVQFDAEKKFSLYPTQTTDNINIFTDLTGYDIIIFDTGGKERLRAVNLSGDQKFSLNALQAGTYILHFRDEYSIKVIKIVKI